MKTYGTATRDGRVWHLEAEPHILLRLRRVFPRVVSSAGPIRVLDTPETCLDLRWVCERWPLRISPADWRHLCERAEGERRTLDAVEQVIAGTLAPRALATALPLRSYQAVAVELVARAHGLLVGDELGVGKTAIGIGLISLPEARPAVVVTATFLPMQWERELKRFIPGIRTHIARKGVPYDMMARGTAKPFRFPANELEANLFPDVVILSYSKVAGWADTLAKFAKSVVFDEAHELRRASTATETSKKYDAATVLAGACQFRLGLTGTPVFNYGDEVRNIIEVLRPDALGAKHEFDAQWCGWGKRIANPAALGTYLRDQGLYIRRTRADVGRELPPLTIVPLPVEVDDAPLKNERGVAAELARKILSREGGSLARGERFRASGELDWRLRQATGIGKAPAVSAFVQLLVEQGEAVLLAGWHHAVYALYAEALDKAGIPFVRFTGEESIAEKRRSVDEFREGRAKVMLMSLRAGAGIDGLQNSPCRVVMFGELDWSPQMHRQLIGRLHRDGQNKQITAYYAYSEEGSDPIVMDFLGVKRQQALGIEDPEAKDIAPVQDSDRARRLAIAYLESLGEKVDAQPLPEDPPEPVAVPAPPVDGKPSDNDLWSLPLRRG